MPESRAKWLLLWLLLGGTLSEIQGPNSDRNTSFRAHFFDGVRATSDGLQLPRSKASSAAPSIEPKDMRPLEVECIRHCILIEQYATLIS